MRGVFLWIGHPPSYTRWSLRVPRSVLFCRAGGPQAMLRGAVLYGGLMYFLSGGLGGPKRTPFEYEEQEIEF